MATSSDRRAPGASRIPFDAMVEVGGALGPSFEAQAVNLSEEGMSLRTAYLPEVGQPITCRFDAGNGAVVVASGEVLWKEDHGDAGEFGIRFTGLDAASTAALQHILGPTEEQPPTRASIDRKVRLHIDGLASPMRARVRGEHGAHVTAYSDLGFLQLGKPLDVEDATSSVRRPALIDRVEVDVDRGSRVPQLVVTLRYDDEEARAHAVGSISPMTVDDAPEEPIDEAHEPEACASTGAAHDDAATPAEAGAATSEEPEGADMKSAFARGALKARADATVAFEKMAKRAKTTFAMLASKIKKGEEAEAPLRRMTAPPPGGALHASGRKVVRGSVVEEKAEAPAPKPRLKITKKKVVVAGAASAALLLALVASRKPAPAPQAAAAPPASAAASIAAPAPAPAPAPTTASAAFGNEDPFGRAGGPDAFGDPLVAPRHGKPIPFSNGPVRHGNVLRLKMDGPVAAIQGAASPTGFTVLLPGRKSLDSAAPLAMKDPRIAAIKVTNETGGAELSVAFKDGVPNYVVKARNDVLEIHLASAAPQGEAHVVRKNRKHRR